MKNLVDLVRDKVDLKEATLTPHQKMVKQLGFPKPPAKKSFYNSSKHGEHESKWEKSGGHAGRNTLDNLVTKAKAAGFKQVDSKDSNTPDGSVVTYGQVYRHPDGHELEVHKRYGSTKEDNHFSARLTHKMHNESVELEEGLWADKKKAWMATFENNVVSKDSSHQGKIDWNTAQYLHKQQHTPASAAEAYLKAKGGKKRGVTFEGVELEEGNVPKVQGFSNFKKMAEDWAYANTHHGKTNIKKHDAVLPNGKILRQTISLGHSNTGHSYMIGVFNHTGKDSEEGYGWHHHRDQGINESTDLQEGRVKELAMDLDGQDSLSDKDFHSKYGKSKAEWRGLLAPPKFTTQRSMKSLNTRIKNANSGANDPEAKARAKMAKMPVREEVHAPGTRVSIDDAGKRKSGKVVRHVPRNQHSGESEAYVVDTGEYESKIVPVHRVRKESVELDEATLPKYDPHTMDEFEAGKEFQYHANQAAYHRNTEGWNLKSNIYNRDWKKELAYHTRHMKALKKVLDFHKANNVPVQEQSSHETRQAQEREGLLTKVKSKVITNQRRVRAGGEKTASNIMQAAAGLRHAHESVELQEGPSMADMHPDNINAIIKQHGKPHRIYANSNETKPGMGFRELKSKLGVGTSGTVHKKFVSHLEKNGFKSSWSHSTNEWVAHPK